MFNFSRQLTQCWLPDKRILQTRYHCAYHLAMKTPLHSPEMPRRSPQVFPETEHSVLPVAGNFPALQPSLCPQSKRLFGSSCGIHQLYLIPKNLEHQIELGFQAFPIDLLDVTQESIYEFVGSNWSAIKICSETKFSRVSVATSGSEVNSPSTSKANGMFVTIVSIFFSFFFLSV